MASLLQAPPHQKPAPWKGSHAKAKLYADILSGAVPKSWNAKKVYQSRPDCQMYKFNLFERNLKALRDKITRQTQEGVEVPLEEAPLDGVAPTADSERGGTMPPNGDAQPRLKVMPWRKSLAKTKLYEDIVSGAVPHSWSARKVFESQPDYQAYKFDLFKRNLKTLREKVEKDFDRKQADVDWMNQDLTVLGEGAIETPYLSPDTNFWHRHDARYLLSEDINSKVHEMLAPKDLYQTKQAYQDFSPTVFRRHIYQERDKKEKQKSRFIKMRLRTMNMKQGTYQGIGRDLIPHVDATQEIPENLQTTTTTSPSTAAAIPTATAQTTRPTAEAATTQMSLFQHIIKQKKTLKPLQREK